jgi:hypothetical protein
MPEETILTSPVVDGNAAMAQQTTTEATSTTSNGGNGLLAETSTKTPAAGRLVDDSGAFTEGWLDRVQGFDEAKQILGQFKDVNGVFKTLVSQQKMLGKMKDAVLLPNDKSTPAELAEYHKRIGVPESSDAYAARPASVPTDMEWDEGAAKTINATAHKLGITPKQMDALVGEYAKFELAKSAAAAEAEAKELEGSRKALAEEWGDKFDVNISKAKRLVQVVGGDMDDPGLSSPGMVKMLARIADTLSDDRLVSADSAATMMAGKARAFDIMKNPDNPLHKRYASGDREIADLVTDILKRG